MLNTFRLLASSLLLMVTNQAKLWLTNLHAVLGKKGYRNVPNFQYLESKNYLNVCILIFILFRFVVLAGLGFGLKDWDIDGWICFLIMELVLFYRIRVIIKLRTMSFSISDYGFIWLLFVHHFYNASISLRIDWH